MALTAQRRASIIAESRTHEKDSGSPQVQISILTDRINGLTEHLRTHNHDNGSRRGLLQMVSRRNRLLRYLQKNDRQAYQALIGRLGLRK
ncbi:MAG: 30S ribosomal protein S15 [Phycisphaeraceae bacterium]|nr:30S ribosomal protein S15 [Phycisphaeraceae bacterium]